MKIISLCPIHAALQVLEANDVWKDILCLAIIEQPTQLINGSKTFVAACYLENGEIKANIGGKIREWTTNDSEKS